MLLVSVKSINGVPIRLTKERWEHIKNSHPELDKKDMQDVLGIISKPDMVLKGDLDEVLAVQKIQGSKVWFVVPYKEIDAKDGFILTAYLTSDIGWLFKKEIVWSKE